MKKKIFGQIGKLKREKIEEYCRLHASVWPGVLEMITECHLHDYSIFLLDDQVFAVFTYDGEDYEKDMEKMAADPLTQEWWKCTHPCFEEYAVSPDSRFYHDMEQIFYLE